MFFCTRLFFTRAIALSDDGGNAGPEVDNRQQDNGIHTVCRSDRSYSLSAETIHKILQQEASKCADAGLDHGR